MRADSGQQTSEVPLEYRVKAGYIYNFARFVEWPANAFEDSRAPIVVGIVGHDLFAKSLAASLHEKAVEGRPIVVTQVDPLARDARKLHILYVSASEQERLPQILQTLADAPILTISEIPQFLEEGGMIRLMLKRGKIQFAVNLPVMQRAGLAASSQMLQYARSVE